MADGDRTGDRQLRVGLVAHDSKKDEMIDWAGRWRDVLAPHALVATGTTGGVIASAHPDLSVRRLRSGPLGGDQQMGALIAEGELDVLIFFMDPLTPMPHDVDVKALIRLAAVYDIPVACTPSTADCIAAQFALLTRRHNA